MYMYIYMYMYMYGFLRKVPPQTPRASHDPRRRTQEQHRPTRAGPGYSL